MPVDIQELTTSALQFLPKLGGALLIFLAFYIAARLLRRMVQRFGRTRRLSPDVVTMMTQITETGLLIFGAVSALGTIGIDVGAMIAGLGLVGFALGFALRDLLSNFLAGFLILVYTPFVRGDHITVSGSDGRVIEINMRYTVLEDDNKRILIPNSVLFQNNVTVQRKSAIKAPAGEKVHDGGA